MTLHDRIPPPPRSQKIPLTRWTVVLLALIGASLLLALVYRVTDSSYRLHVRWKSGSVELAPTN